MKVTNGDHTIAQNKSTAVRKASNKEKKEQSYTMQYFGERLIELRNERKLSQQQSADLIGISRNTLSMYERGERCASIDVAVNAANKYGVTLDYLFGRGYKLKEHNDMSVYSLGLSETSLDLLSDSKTLGFVDAILSNPCTQKLVNLIYCTHYKPLINSYEINYMSRLAADLLYSMIVSINKDAYKLHPMSEAEIDELNEAVEQCIIDIRRQEYLLTTDYDAFADCEDDVLSELERIKFLLEDAESRDLNDAKQDGFNEAIKMIARGEMVLPQMRTPTSAPKKQK